MIQQLAVMLYPQE